MTVRAIFSIFVLSFFAPPATIWAAQPHIFFSDLESAPNSGGQGDKGAFVTIYGNGFGASQGTAGVTIGGGPAAIYPIWTDTKVTFQLGKLADTGDIVLHSPRGISNGVHFTIRTGNIYYVSPTGADSRRGTFTSPWRTLTKARDSMRAGDIIYALDGVKQDVDDGQGWHTCFLLTKGGTADMPMAIVAYPGATVTIGNIEGPESGIRCYDLRAIYWVFAGLRLRGRDEAVTTYGTAYWRLVGNDLSCPNANGASACFETSLTWYVKFLGNNVHDTGIATASTLYHGVYFSTDSNHIEVGWNLITNVHGGRGIQVHSSPLNNGGPKDPTGHSQFDLVIHDNIIHDTQCDGIILATIDPSKGKIELYNNLIYDAGTGPNNPEHSGNWSCINIGSWTNTGPPGSGVVEVYNNTLYNCGTFSTPPYGHSRSSVAYSGPNTNIRVHMWNNIVYQGAEAPYLTIARPDGHPCTNYDDCDWFTASNNVFYGNGAPPSGKHIENSISRDPLFCNLKKLNFHLQSKSPAQNAGKTSLALFDRDGVPRQKVPDLGAYGIESSN